ncbi:DUF4153 domain-containing protein [Kibdelosporangium lantanae]|uniref:DUF4153 domain-containing protein n=1 Tax=Kibdelosporangium lantanae TaxID=1497396 RepID=A0ABW3MJ51_9PSEU
MADVAREAGVSGQTVSRVANGKTNVDDTTRDRVFLRSLLGALCLLMLVVVASALTRMWAYQEAYGFTVMRLLVEACELWLGVVYLLVIAAGVRLSGKLVVQLSETSSTITDSLTL